MRADPFASLRIGAVSYLNTRPLIRGIDDSRLILDVPSRLAERFFSQELDVSLLPLFEVLHSGGGVVVDGVSISCCGTVHSVIVASQTPFSDCGSIYLDPSSRSSAALLRVLLAEYYSDGPRVLESANLPEDAARLLIGDPAIDYRRVHGDRWNYQDLGEMWHQHTGLPFVFAVWAIQPELDGAPIAASLREICKNGLAERSLIADQEPDQQFALQYLTKFIHYGIGEKEKQAIALFSNLLKKYGLIAQEPKLLFV